jgi:CMP-N-acetylneuraminic acid synthetase
MIPARGGSERVPGKNTRELDGHPLIAYAIAGARNVQRFDRILVSTECEEIGETAKDYGAEWIKRPEQYARADSPDIEWVEHLCDQIKTSNPLIFVILRPTNPFRTSDTIKEALRLYGVSRSSADGWQTWASLRSVQEVKQHPDKMWEQHMGFGKRIMGPLGWIRGECYEKLHDLPTQSLRKVYVQNGCIHIATRALVRHYGNYTGTATYPFFTRKYEGFDINDEDDFLLAEILVERGIASLEPIP